MEPILQETHTITDLIEYPEIWNLYKKHERSFWTIDFFHFDEDLNDWDHKLNQEERYFIKHILAFFARADLLVADNLIQNFCNEVQIKESKTFYAFQGMMENIHNETYMKMITCFVSEKKEREDLFNSHIKIPCIKRKADWARKWMDPSRNFAERLISFICIEGIHFCSSFAGIYWLKERALMHQLCKSNEYISRDETLHVLHGIALFKLLHKKPPPATVHQIFQEAVDLEVEFCNSAIPCKFIGLNTALMKEYVEFIANQYLELMGVELLYPKRPNPLPFMEKITAKIQVNFFEIENADYRMKTSIPDDGDYDQL